MPPLATLPLAVISERSNVDLATLRRYERLGLLSRPRRTPGGLVLYSPDEVERVSLIKRAIELRFSVPTIREMLGIGRRTRPSCREMQTIVRRQLAETRRQIEQLVYAERALVPLLEACQRSGPLEACSIVVALSQPPSRTNE